MSSSSGVTKPSQASQSRQPSVISETCFEHLCLEISRTVGADGGPEANDDGLDIVDEIGFDVGYRFAERLASNRQRHLTTLDVIRFACKEVWSEVFRTQIDKLQTDHKGVYVLHDSKFRWIARLSVPSGQVAEAAQQAQQFLTLPCGILRGVLTNLGLPCTVTAEVQTVPYCELKTIRFVNFYFMPTRYQQAGITNTGQHAQVDQKNIFSGVTAPKHV